MIDVKRQQGKRQKQAGGKGGRGGKGGAFGGLAGGQPVVTGAAALKTLLGAAPAAPGGLQPFGAGVAPFGFGGGGAAGAGWD